MRSKKKNGLGRVLVKGRYLKFMSRRGWEYVERVDCAGIAVIVAVNSESKLLFVEQYREPLKSKVIEFPAGLTDVVVSQRKESTRQTAFRELFEETGYKANKMRLLTSGPVSSGLSTEVITIYLATGLKKIHAGGGDESESIIVREVHVDHVRQWLESKRKEGFLVDPKVYAGLFFLKDMFGCL